MASTQQTRQLRTTTETKERRARQQSQRPKPARSRSTTERHELQKRRLGPSAGYVKVHGGYPVRSSLGPPGVGAARTRKLESRKWPFVESTIRRNAQSRRATMRGADVCGPCVRPSRDTVALEAGGRRARGGAARGARSTTTSSVGQTPGSPR
eukprot:2082087-Prymnesium_polylepis.1